MLFNIQTSKSLIFRNINQRVSLSLSLSTVSSQLSNEDQEIANFIMNSNNLVVITGAGMSTSSGIPDYRSPEGSYSKGHKPIINSDFINNEYSRKRYWARSMLGYSIFARAKPNDGHYSLSRIESRKINKSFLIVTQNVDRLHQKAGSKNVVDLHGRNDRLSCLQCNADISRSIVQKQIELLNPEILEKIKLLLKSDGVNSSLRADGDANLDGIIDYNIFKVPSCTRCAGILKPKVVFFGDNVNPNTVQDIYKTVENSDALLIIGTSLEVYSAFRFVDRFAKKSNNIAIINQGQTRADYSNIPIKIRSESNCSILLKKTADLIDNFYQSK